MADRTGTRRLALTAAFLLFLTGFELAEGPLDPILRVTQPLKPERLLPSARQAVADYERFAERHAGGNPATSRFVLARVLRRLAREPEPEPELQPLSRLRREVEKGLAIGELLEHLDEHALDARVLTQSNLDGVEERLLLLTDEEVGSFGLRLLLPQGQGPLPVVLGLHGHRDGSATFRDRYLGLELARRGFAVAMPEFRLMTCGRREAMVSRTLLARGRSLLGLRVYETLLVRRTLAAMPEIDLDRLGVLGHSGGSSVARLLAFLPRPPRAVVLDHHSSFRNRCAPGGVHCETVPALFAIGPLLNDMARFPRPFLEVPYGPWDRPTRDRILTFLEAQLTPPP